MSEVDQPPQTLDPDLRDKLDLQDEDPGQFIHCRHCAHIITSASQRIDVQGGHDHHFVNPHGFNFHVGCYAQALGCDISGGYEAADSWFGGYVWQIASCAGCQGHLGWYFSPHSGTGQPFYGLILDRLQEQR